MEAVRLVRMGGSRGLGHFGCMGYVIAGWKTTADATMTEGPRSSALLPSPAASFLVLAAATPSRRLLAAAARILAAAAPSLRILAAAERERERVGEREGVCVRACA